MEIRKWSIRLPSGFPIPNFFSNCQNLTSSPLDVGEKQTLEAIFLVDEVWLASLRCSTPDCAPSSTPTPVTKRGPPLPATRAISHLTRAVCASFAVKTGTGGDMPAAGGEKMGGEEDGMTSCGRYRGEEDGRRRSRSLSL